MQQDPTLLLEPQNEPPVAGVQGKTRGITALPLGAPLENFSQNDSLALDKAVKNSGVILREEFDIEKSSEDLSYLEPATIARRILSKVEYKQEYCETMLAYFISKPKTSDKVETYVWKKTGMVDERYKTVANPPPMFSEFGRTIGVSEKTLQRWAKTYPEFGEVYEICQGIIQEFFVSHGVRGDYAGQFGIFAAKNLTNMKDVQVNKNENYDMKSILDAIEKGYESN